MKLIGVVSYNIHCNFTNYGSALQSYALSQAINRLGNGKYTPILVDYCPDILADKDPRNPMKHMWDQDDAALKRCQLSLPAILENYEKFDAFYNTRFNKTKKTYTSENFDEIVDDEDLAGFVCGSDTIFCIDEFGFDDGYYANYPCMKDGYSVSYAASFGDSYFTDESLVTLNRLLKNFKAIGLREEAMVSYVKDHTSVRVERVIDPTLLLSSEDYDKIAAPRLEDERYLLLYSRRYNPEMTAHAEKIAKQYGLRIVEISLCAENAEIGHRMFYEAGVEEYLSLVKYADYVVTNSYHGLIFCVQYRRPFVVFSREQADSKIDEVLSLLGLESRKMLSDGEPQIKDIDYDSVHDRILKSRISSLEYLSEVLNNCP